MRTKTSFSRFAFNVHLHRGYWFSAIILGNSICKNNISFDNCDNRFSAIYNLARQESDPANLIYISLAILIVAIATVIIDLEIVNF